MLTTAIEIANKAHADAVDKGGHPYIFHPLRVMLACETETEQICAVLHDVLEDTDNTAVDLLGMGFSEQVIEVLDCLTRRSEETYDQFIDRLKVNPTARRVKLADLADNMDMSRIETPGVKDFARIEKYKRAVQTLKDDA